MLETPTTPCMLFGKYKGTPISEMKIKHYDYCIWLKDQEWIKNWPTIYDEIKNLRPAPITMPWGRHKGLTIENLYVNEPNYFRWLRDNDIIKKNKRVWDEICKFT